VRERRDMIDGRSGYGSGLGSRITAGRIYHPQIASSAEEAKAGQDLVTIC